MTTTNYTVIIWTPVWRKDGPAAQNSTVWYTGTITPICRRLSGMITVPTVFITRLMEKAEGRSAAGDGMGLSAPAEAPVSTPLGSYTTAYSAGSSRATNIALAVSRINGVVVQPGESFSFSTAILPRTSANGYVEAPTIVNKKYVPGIGGGICQVSSTLYAAMLTAGLPATERHPHSLQVAYIPEGMDATISGTALDLRFTNIFAEPLQIQAAADQGTLTISLYRL